MHPHLESLLFCPRCSTRLQRVSGTFVCEKKHSYPIEKGIPVFSKLLDNKYEDPVFSQYYLQTHYPDWIKKSVSRNTLATFDWPGFFTRTHSYYTDLFKVFGGVLTKQSTVLDLGCSVGRLTFECAKYAKFAIGIDPSRLHIGYADDILQNNKLSVTLGQSQIEYKGEKTATFTVPVKVPDNVAFLVGDDGSLPFADESIDVIVSSAVIDRVPDAEKFIQRCERILCPKGYILLTTPFNWQDLFTSKKKWLGKGGYGTKVGPPEDALKELMENQGFKRLRAENIPWTTHCDKRFFFTWSIHAALFQKQ